MGLETLSPMSGESYAISDTKMGYNEVVKLGAVGKPVIYTLAVINNICDP